MSQNTSSLSVLSIICKVSCVVGFRPIALETTYLVASSMHLILNVRAECIAIFDGASGCVVIPFGRETNTGHLEDASDRTTRNSIKSAVCNTDFAGPTDG